MYKYIYIYYIRPKINTIRKSSVTWRKIPIENPRIIFDSQLPFHVTKQYRIHPEILGGFNSSCCCLDAPRTSLVMRWPSFGRRIDFYGGPFDVLSFFFKYVFENDNSIDDTIYIFAHPLQLYVLILNYMLTHVWFVGVSWKWWWDSGDTQLDDLPGYLLVTGSTSQHLLHRGWTAVQCCRRRSSW